MWLVKSVFSDSSQQPARGLLFVFLSVLFFFFVVAKMMWTKSVVKEGKQ
jgi:hypothetical protein